MRARNIIAVLFLGMIAISLHAETIEQIKKSLADKEQEIRTLMLATPGFKEKLRQALEIEKQIDTQAPNFKQLERELEQLQWNICQKEENDPMVKELNRKIQERLDSNKRIRPIDTPEAKELNELTKQRSQQLEAILGKDVNQHKILFEQIKKIEGGIRDLLKKYQSAVSEASALANQVHPQLQELIWEQFNIESKIRKLDPCFYARQQPEGIKVVDVVIPYKEITK